jgi:HK97 family phage portal protein
VLPHGSELKQLNLSPQEAEYIATRQYGAKDIARMFGVPAYMIGADDGGVKSSVEQQAQDFYVQTIMPLVVMIEQELARKLLREDEKPFYYFKFQFNSLLRADSKSRAEFYNMGIRGGWLSPNDARKFEDMDIIAEGDMTFMESNLVPADMARPWIQSKIDAAPTAANSNQ